MEKTLLVLAAGMGSRYGGLKQMEGFGPRGETILEYSIYDALEAGFSRFVFVIRASIEADFRMQVLERLPRDLNVHLCFQELDKLPNQYDVPEGRVKPWGTGHAVWVARDLVPGPFAVVNGDDFYGRSGFRQLSDYFSQSLKGNHAMVAYPLGKTLSKTGSVSRGICKVDENEQLLEVREVVGIRKNSAGLVSESSSPVELGEETPASMNLFGFDGSVFEAIDHDFGVFLEQEGAGLKSEFYIPTVVNHLLESGSGKIQVLRSEDDWMGVTNPQDRAQVVEGIRKLVNAGVYPESLWNH